MGEYAGFRGDQVKIGTCEQMYYLRADQAHLVRALPGNVDPLKDAEHLRFRFPFPDEDHIQPGAFGDFDRTVVLDVAACEPQHLADCPDARIGVHSQRCLDGLRMLVARCTVCRDMWRLPTPEDARPYVRACFLKAADALGRGDDAESAFYAALAERIVAGYRPHRAPLATAPTEPAPAPEPVEPAPTPAAAPAANDTRKFYGVKEAVAAIRTALKARSGKSWSVTHGRGTAYGWINIEVPPKARVDGYMTPEQTAELAKLLGVERVHHQGYSVSPDSREWVVAQAEGRDGGEMPALSWD